MTYLHIFAVFIALLGFSNPSVVYGGSLSSSVSTGKIMILPPPDHQEAGEWRGASGKTSKSGEWLALVCDASKCRLVSVMFKVTKNPLPPEGEMTESFIAKWDLSVIREDEHIVLLLMPHAVLEPGAVQTWHLGSRINGLDRAETGKETVVSTALIDKPDRKSILTPIEITNKSCSQAQASLNECRNTYRLQLLEGKTRQWMGGPLTEPCYPIGEDAYFPNNYLQWVGDLDHDQKPDYIIHLSWADGYILMLSSLAKPGQLVGMAGHYKTWRECD